MATFLKTFAVILCFVALVPLSVLAATGRWTRAWEALRGYGIAMAVIVVPGVVAAVIVLIQRAF